MKLCSIPPKSLLQALCTAIPHWLFLKTPPSCLYLISLLDYKLFERSERVSFTLNYFSKLFCIYFLENRTENQPTCLHASRNQFAGTLRGGEKNHKVFEKPANILDPRSQGIKIWVIMHCILLKYKKQPIPSQSSNPDKLLTLLWSPDPLRNHLSNVPTTIHCISTAAFLMYFNHMWIWLSSPSPTGSLTHLSSPHFI